MNLLELRQQFVRVSGRYDLVVDSTNWQDNGANFYINAGQRWLDQKIEGFGAGVAYKKLTAGIVGCNLENCRAVREVWVQNATDKVRNKLTKYSREKLLTYYNGFFSDVTGGQPLFYYLPAQRLVPDNITISQLESYMGFLDTSLKPVGNLVSSLVVLPPPDIDYVLELHGLFFTPAFVSDLDETLWSVNYPTLLLWAALREVEVTYRNTEGVKDWTAAIDARLVDFDKDAVEQDIAGVSEMGQIGE